MTTPKEEDLRKGLETLVGGMKADEFIRRIREDRSLTTLEKRQLATQASQRPISQEQAQAIGEYLGIDIEATTSSSEGE